MYQLITPSQGYFCRERCGYKIITQHARGRQIGTSEQKKKVARFSVDYGVQPPRKNPPEPATCVLRDRSRNETINPLSFLLRLEELSAAATLEKWLTCLRQRESISNTRIKNQLEPVSLSYSSIASQSQQHRCSGLLLCHQPPPPEHRVHRKRIKTETADWLKQTLVYCVAR